MANDLALQLTTPLASGKHSLKDFRATEQLSVPFEMHLEVESDNTNIDFEALIEKSITVTVLTKPKKRYFNGVVGHVSQQSFSSTKKKCIYQVTLYPKFWTLKFSREFKIFQKKNAITIIKDVLQENGVTKVDDRTSKCGKTVREYCVQYGESHFDFVSRLMEEEGIFYYFEHANGNHTMVLGDQASAHKPIKESAQIEVDYARSEKPFLNVVTGCFIEQQFVAGEHSMTDYNYSTPKTKLFAKAKGKGKGKEVYDYPGLADIEYKPNKGGSEKWSSLRSEMDDAPRETIVGASTCPFFEAGSTFTLKKHLRKAANKKYTLHTVEHHITLKTDEDDPLFSPGEIICTNEFKGFPAATPFRPPIATQKPQIAGTQTAVVTGPSGEEIYTDDDRRIKVQFHWDREGKKDDKTTCWVRVSQAWASNNWGILFTPRIGMEVVVSFINGDPDKPLVTGCVYNADNVPPYLAKDKTMSTIKSDTHKGKGFNEFRFEDKKKKEEIYLHAQRDWNTHVLENRTTVLEKGSDFKTIKKGDREVVIEGGSGVIKKKGDAPSLKHSGSSASKKGNDLLTIKKGSRIVKIEGKKGNYKTTITDGNRETTIKKGDNKDKFMKGNDTRTLMKGNKSLKIMKGNYKEMLMKGNKDVKIMKGNESKTIMKGNKDLKMLKGNKMSLIASGNDTLLMPSGLFTGIMAGLLLKIGGLVIAIGGGGSGSKEAMPGHNPDNPGESPPSGSRFTPLGLGGASGDDDPPKCVESNIESPCGDFNFKFNDNNITIEQNGEKKYSCTKDYEEKVGGTYTLEVDGDIIIKCKGDIKIESDKNIEFKAKKDIKFDAKKIDFKAKADFKVKTAKFGVKSSGPAEIKASILKLNA